LKIDIGEVAVRLLADQGLSSRARTAARAIAQVLPGTAVNIYTLVGNPVGNSVGNPAGEGPHLAWRSVATAGEVSVHAAAIPAESGTLGELFSERSALVFSGPDVPREQYGHLDIRRTVLTLAYLPLAKGEELFGGIEILSFDTELHGQEISELEPLAHVTAAALAAAQSYEVERDDTLGSINRLTQLYDMEKVFSSTLEMAELLPIIGSKIREVMECQAVNIWLLQPDESVEVMHQAGSDPTMPHGSSQKAGEGLAGAVSDNGEPLLIDNPEDPRLVQRNNGAQSGGVASLAIVPIMDKESLVGVIEVVNKLDGTALDDDDLFALGSLAETASTALHNAGLLLAERKVEILETLVTVSHEITSTLNLERMLQTIVNAPQAVIPYERAAIALEQRGRFKLSAVTGVTQVNADAPEIAPLDGIVQWAALSEEVIHVRQHGEVVDAPREETRAKFEKYFAKTGVRGFYAVPLGDDTGRVGMYALESSDPDFLSSAHIEILQVLTGQATVALRNAQMYKEVPFISVLQPVLERKRKFMAMEKKRRAAIITLVAAAIIFLAICPLPFRVDGDAVIAPLHRVQVQPEIEGVVGAVYVREGQTVTRGQVIAELNAWDFRSALAGAESKYQTAVLQVNHSLAVNDGGEAGVERVQADYWKSEVERAKSLLQKTQLRSPLDGVISTANVENLVGRRLQYGDTFAEVMDTSRAVADVAVSDRDAGMLKAGQPAVIKLNSYATRTFRGNVIVVSPKAEVVNDTRVFFARVELPNSDGAIRSGMEGRGKVRVGWRPAGFVLFRPIALWFYSRIWSLLGW
jgi:RND family efflux transporter MFP subunit